MAQAAGLAMAIAGLAIRVPVSERVAVSLVPTGNGAAVGGTF